MVKEGEQVTHLTMKNHNANSHIKEEHWSKAILDPIKICKKKAFSQFENKNKSPLDKKIKQFKFKLYSLLFFEDVLVTGQLR